MRIYKSGQAKEVSKFTSKIDRTHFVYELNSIIYCQKKRNWTKLTSTQWITKDPKMNVSPHGKFNKRQICQICNFSRSNNGTSDDLQNDLVAKGPLVKFPLLLVLKVPWGNM